MKPSKNSLMLLLSLTLLVGCTTNNNKQNSIIRKVKIEPVQQADSVSVRSFPGILKEAAQINVAFRVAGPIRKMMVNEGDFIQAGQVVAQMDTRDYEVQLAAAQAQYDQVKAEVNRVIELHNRKSVAGKDYDKAVSGLKMVEIQLKHAKNQLHDTKLKAPVSGYIQKINFLENEMVDAGMPVITMINTGHYQVEVEIPVALYAERKGIITFSGLQPTVSKEEFPLDLLSYSRKASNNQLYKVQLRINSATQPKLAPGMDIQVNILLKNNTRSMASVSLNALFYENGKTYVWVYESGGTIRKHEVVTGPLTGNGRIGITHGVQINEQVVIAGASSLHENDKVEPLEPVSETNVGGLL